MDGRKQCCYSDSCSAKQPFLPAPEEVFLSGGGGSAGSRTLTTPFINVHPVWALMEGGALPLGY